MRKYFSWNEPESERDRKSNKTKKPSDGPPDLDQLMGDFLKKWSARFNQGWGQKNRSGSGGHNPPPGGSSFQLPFYNGHFFAGLALALCVVVIGFSGFYTVEPGEEAAVFRFGHYIGKTGPGPHWLLPIVYDQQTVNTQVINQRKFEDDLITKEVNIVTVSVAVQYHIENLEHFLFNVYNPEESLSEVTRSAIRQVVADATLDEVLSTRGKLDSTSFIGGQIQDLVEKNLSLYQSGIKVDGVEILAMLPPQQVKAAFNDAIQAQEDEIRFLNEAEAYERKVVPVAEGQAARMIQDAKAYGAEVTLIAEGDVARFKAILPEYKKSPQVTRTRLYLETMEKALIGTPKMLIDSRGQNNTFLVPFDKWMGIKNGLQVQSDGRSHAGLSVVRNGGIQNSTAPSETGESFAADASGESMGSGSMGSMGSGSATTSDEGSRRPVVNRTGIRSWRE